MFFKKLCILFLMINISTKIFLKHFFETPSSALKNRYSKLGYLIPHVIQLLYFFFRENPTVDTNIVSCSYQITAVPTNT